MGVVSRQPGWALIFDLDGVIVDSNPVHSACWREYLAGCGISVGGDFDSRMYGRRNDEIVRSVFGEGLDPAEVLRHGAEKEKLYRRRMGPVLNERLVPGLRAFLEKRKELPMAVASNAERANVDFVLDTAGLRRYFRAVVDGGQVKRPKPDPEVFLRAAELLKRSPAACIIFEDSLAGVEAARAAGARVVGLTTTHDRLGPADLNIADFLDPGLEPWLSEQQAG
jgi:beta-phosphoglucomutase